MQVEDAEQHARPTDDSDELHEMRQEPTMVRAKSAALDVHIMDGVCIDLTEDGDDDDGDDMLDTIAQGQSC